MYEERYVRLMQCVRDHLVYPLLGKNYYNTNDDLFGHDEQIIKDIKRKIDNMVKTIRFLVRRSIIIICVYLIVKMF